MNALIVVNNLSFEYPLTDHQRIAALKNVSFEIQRGEYVAIIGANGSGKTTLARHLNGLLIPSKGSVLINGLDTRDSRNLSTILSRIGMVMQYPEDQIVATEVEDEVAFGPENLGLPPAVINRRVEESLRAVGMWEHRHRPPYLLSAGQIQRIALAGVLAVRPECIIFDEATAMLDPIGRRKVMEIIHNLHAQGLTIIHVTHFMSEAAQADRVLVMRKGELVMDDSPQGVFGQKETLQQAGLDLPVAAQLAGLLREAGLPVPTTALTVQEILQSLPVYHGDSVHSNKLASSEKLRNDGSCIVQVEHLQHQYLKGTPLEHTALLDVNLNVNRGSTHAILGATGSGKSTLLQHLNGLLLPQSGRVRTAEFDLSDPAIDLQALRRTAGLVFQIPETQFFEQYVGDEIAFGPRMLGRLDTLREDVRWAMETVGLDFEGYKDRLTFTLSGGESRKAALASILAIRPQILLLDEPMAGLDPLSRRDLLQKLKGLTAEGLTVILSSHYMEDMVDSAEEITLINSGRDVMNGSVEDVFSRIDSLMELGLEPPVTPRVAQELRERGWPLPPNLIRPAELAAAVAPLVRQR